MREYRSSNLTPVPGLLMLLVAAVVGGLIIGGTTYAVSKVVYLILFFPIIMGLAGGGIIALAVMYGKVRSPLIAGLFGVLIGLILYGSYRYAEYAIGFRHDFRQDAQKTYGQNLTDDDLKSLEDFVLKSETGSTGFIGYIRLTAKRGITITQTGGPPSGTALKGLAAYLYWLVELAFILPLASLTARKQATTPFSEETNEWFGKVKYLGTIAPQAVPQFLEFLRQNQPDRAGALLWSNIQAPMPRTDITIRSTSSPTADLLIAVQRVAFNRANLTRHNVYQGFITPVELEAIQNGMRMRAKE